MIVREYGMVLLFGAFCLALVGCGRSVPAQADPEVARKALKTALEAWQKQETSDSLTQASPPIFFNDPKWKAGTKLLAFEILPNHVHHGPSVRMTASLTLEQKEARERKVNYLVDVAHAVVIVPD